MTQFQQDRTKREDSSPTEAKLNGNKEELKGAVQKKEEFSQVTYQDAKDASAKGERPIVVLYYWGTTCGPCKTINAELPKVAAEQDKSKVKFFKSFDTDDDKGSDDALSHGVKAVPAIVFFKNGEEVHKLTGFPVQKTAELVREKLNSLATAK